MKIYVDRKPENCNHCVFNPGVNRYFDLDDCCYLNKKNTSRIIMDKDCPLKELEGVNT
jgi:hypothetical protein